MGQEGLGGRGTKDTINVHSHYRVHLPLSSAVLEGPGTCLEAISLTASSQNRQANVLHAGGDRGRVPLYSSVHATTLLLL